MHATSGRRLRSPDRRGRGWPIDGRCGGDVGGDVGGDRRGVVGEVGGGLGGADGRGVVEHATGGGDGAGDADFDERAVGEGAELALEHGGRDLAATAGDARAGGRDAGWQRVFDQYFVCRGGSVVADLECPSDRLAAENARGAGLLDRDVGGGAGLQRRARRVVGRFGIVGGARDRGAIEDGLFPERGANGDDQVDRADFVIGEVAERAGNGLAAERAAGVIAHVGLPRGQRVADEHALGFVGPGVFHGQRVGDLSGQRERGGAAFERRCLVQLEVGRRGDEDRGFGPVVGFVWIGGFAAHFGGVRDGLFREGELDQDGDVNRARGAVGEIAECAGHLLAAHAAAGVVAEVALPGGQLVGDGRAFGGVGAGVGGEQRVGDFAVYVGAGRRGCLFESQIGGCFDLDFGGGSVVRGV